MTTSDTAPANLAQIARAAELAGKWWADRIRSERADSAQCEEFAKVLAGLIAQTMLGEIAWKWNVRGPQSSDNQPRKVVNVEFDYDPDSLLFEALARVFGEPPYPKFFSDWFPSKHHLEIRPTVIRPKEGYGNWTAAIPVPVK